MAYRLPRLTVASNRLPVRVTRDSEEEWSVRRSSGGLVSALRPVLAERGGTWLGWSGVCDVAPARLDGLLEEAGEGFDLKPVTLTSDDVDGYYLGYSNRMLWPFLHGLPHFSEPRPGDWPAYRRVNAVFAQALSSCAQGPVWVHDYHLMLVAQELRSEGFRHPVGYFLHTPFPEPDVIRTLPQVNTILCGLMSFDSIGFQTRRDRGNFIEAVQELAPEAPGQQGTTGPCAPLKARARAFPISIDTPSWSRRASSPAVERRAAEIRRTLGSDLVLGVDRLDYSKGIPHKLRGYARALERYPSLRGRVVLRQLAIPTRQQIPAYAELRQRVEELAREVNHRFGTSEWTPVELIVGTWDTDELTAQYRAADVLLVTSLRDGMNLVAKEFCASSVADGGVLVLSSFAGSASQLGSGALMVDPRDADGLARAIHRGVTMDRGERHWRMAILRSAVRDADVRAWAANALDALDARGETGTTRRPMPGTRSSPPVRRKRRRHSPVSRRRATPG